MFESTIFLFKFDIMKNISQPFTRIFHFYLEGFRSMTWGRTLWLIILIKLFVMFGILRIFFFQPVLAGKSTEEKQEIVAGSFGSSTSPTTITDTP